MMIQTAQIIRESPAQVVSAVIMDNANARTLHMYFVAATASILEMITNIAVPVPRAYATAMIRTIRILKAETAASSHA